MMISLMISQMARVFFEQSPDFGLFGYLGVSTLSRNVLDAA